MKKTLINKIIRGTDLRVLIIGDNEESSKELKVILKGFDIITDVAEKLNDIIKMYENNIYDIIFIEDREVKKDISEIINMIRDKEEGGNPLIIGILKDEDKEFRKILNENNIELILFKPVKEGQIVVILRNDFKEKILLNY